MANPTFHVSNVSHRHCNGELQYSLPKVPAPSLIPRKLTAGSCKWNLRMEKEKHRPQPPIFGFHVSFRGLQICGFISFSPLGIIDCVDLFGFAQIFWEVHDTLPLMNSSTLLGSKRGQHLKGIDHLPTFSWQSLCYFTSDNFPRPDFQKK